jgi:hypothetical protein
MRNNINIKRKTETRALGAFILALAAASCSIPMPSGWPASFYADIAVVTVDGAGTPIPGLQISYRQNRAVSELSKAITDQDGRAHLKILKNSLPSKASIDDIDGSDHGSYRSYGLYASAEGEIRVTMDPAP